MNIEQLQTVLDWNYSGVALPPHRPPLVDETLAHTFEQHAKRNPSRCALISEDNTNLTYSQVNERAAAIVRCLLLHAPRSESGLVQPACALVALQRTAALPIALLAVVKSGLSYWGVDMVLQSPAVVLKNMKSLNSHVAVVDDETFTLLFPEGNPDNISVVTLSSNGEVLFYRAAHRQEQASGFLCPIRTMYIEFTSGSTGQPKAVAVPHKACVSYVRNSAPIYRWGVETRSLLYHSVSFDLHVHDLWGPWCHGGCVIVVDVPIADANGVWERGRDTAATHLSMTPFGFSLFTKVHLRRFTGTEYAALESVMLCGEALDMSSVAPWIVDEHGRPKETYPSIVNSYGITETTVVNTFLEVTPERLGWPSAIGRRLPHTLMMLLDSNKAVVPHGTQGEIYLAGDCLAAGYITSVEKNDLSFVSVPAPLIGVLRSICPTMNFRTMYKTGDVAVYREEHEGFVFCGRCDNEIKSGGFRVNPLEVEEHLCKFHSIVLEAVVVPAKHPDGRTVLFACIVPRDANVTKAVVRSALREVVAEYKVPLMHLMPLSYHFPVTASNKVDRVLLSKWAAECLGLPPQSQPTWLP